MYMHVYKYMYVYMYIHVAISNLFIELALQHFHQPSPQKPIIMI